MKAEDWMVCSVSTCGPETSMSDAAYLMWQNDCGVLPVIDAAGKVVGLITDRDMCMSACLGGKPLAELRVEQAMSRQVFSCSPSDTIEQVIRVMGDHQVRRIPVVDAQERLVGILTMNDLVRKLIGLNDSRQRAGIEQRLVEALASICETREAALPEPVPSRSGSRLRATPVA